MYCKFVERSVWDVIFRRNLLKKAKKSVFNATRGEKSYCHHQWHLNRTFLLVLDVGPGQLVLQGNLVM